MRFFSTLRAVEESLPAQVLKQLRAAGFPKTSCEEVTLCFLDELKPLLMRWAQDLPLFLQLRVVVVALLVCRTSGVFLTPRYTPTTITPCASDQHWEDTMVSTFKGLFQERTEGVVVSLPLGTPPTLRALHH